MFKTENEMREQGFEKIGQQGSIFIVAVFYNATTKERTSMCVRDYDYSDCSRDNDELYYLPINEKAKYQFDVDNGIIRKGMTIEVYKGRKVPIGTVARVLSLQEWRDKYGRVQTVYANLSNGMRTSVDNCRVLY